MVRQSFSLLLSWFSVVLPLSMHLLRVRRSPQLQGPIRNFELGSSPLEIALFVGNGNIHSEVFGCSTNIF